MAKTRTSVKRKKSSKKLLPSKNKGTLQLKKGALVRKSNPTEEILNEELISRALWECLKEGDSEGFLEVIRIYSEAYNKTHMAKGASVSRSTIYSLRGGNPTVQTVAKIVHACA
jgi:DNA-binding phage protein